MHRKRIITKNICAELCGILCTGFDFSLLRSLPDPAMVAIVQFELNRLFVKSGYQPDGVKRNNIKPVFG
jgi:hypothetical protein